MTGYTVHTGTSEKFSDGWDKIFGKKSSSKKSKSPASVRQQKAVPSPGKKTRKK